MLTLLNIQNITGFHSWLSYRGSVLDASILQEHTTFDLKNGYITGEIPEGLEMYGFEEGWGTVERYVQKFAKRMGLKVSQWIDYHNMVSIETFLKIVETYHQKV